MALRTDAGWIFSAQDLISQFECDHRVGLNLSATLGLIEKPKIDDPNLKLLQELGQLFERRRLSELEKTTKVLKLSQPQHIKSGYELAWQETKAAMEAEADVIYQATLFDGKFVGIVDFLLLRKDEAGNIQRDGSGLAIYEPVDSKSARREKVSAVIQVGGYSNLLVKLGRAKPIQVHLWLAGERDWSGDAAKAMAVAQEIEKELLANSAAVTGLPVPLWAPPRPSCSTCAWSENCESGRRADRDLSLIQGIRSISRERLVNGGIQTIDQMASADDAQRPARVGEQTFGNLRAQADIQIRGEKQGKVLAETIKVAELAKFPLSSPGDIWFDMEGDPYADEGRGHEYMFGYVFLVDGKTTFKTCDAITLVEEQAAFEEFIDFVMKRWKEFPDLHIYHYADYERRALTRLSQKYNSRVAELDAILRSGLLVDMYSLIRKSIRFSTESLSIKYVEEIYGVSHQDEDVKSAKDSIVAFHSVQALKLKGDDKAADEEYEQIKAYNQKDCESTFDFDRWIRRFAEENDIQLGQVVVSQNQESTVPSDYQVLSDRLGKLIDENQDMSVEDKAAISLLRGALLFHERENKVSWWRIFDAVEQDLESLARQTGAMVVGEIIAEDWIKPPRAKKHRRELIVNGVGVSAEDALSGEPSVAIIYESSDYGMMSPAGSIRGFSKGKIDRFEDGKAIITESSGPQDEMWFGEPVAIIHAPQYQVDSLQKALAALAMQVLEEEALPKAAWSALLKRLPPEGLTQASANHREDIIATLKSGSEMCVAVQGPPGTGKTFVGSRVVAELAKAGWRIGVVGQSHNVVENFIEKVMQVDPALAVGKKPKEAKQLQWEISDPAGWILRQPEGFVLGGTAWTFADPTVQAMGLDLLVVDEAGQFSITMTLASAVGASRILLLGDPQQLPQVSQAAHPEGAEVSALEHYAAGSKTLSPDVGFFLETTYRMHPLLTEKVSALQYEGKLSSSPDVNVRNLEGVKPGLISVAVNHTGNTTRSEEEAEQVVKIASELLGKNWIDNEGPRPLPPVPLAEDNVIVVAAFNDQVRTIRSYLRKAGLGAIRVGTVDKFQGQEAAIVIVSMATSSEEDLPRGVEFLLSPNRLNVAISRGKWASYLVHSPELRKIAPTSVEGLINLGGFLELAN